jgi:hypothetical protein
MTNFTRRSILLLTVTALLLPLAGCGYALAGRGSFLPAHIRTIGIPQFTNLTSLFDVERVVTERVRTEFIGRGKYTIFPDSVGRDAVLLGEISSITITPAALGPNGLATRYAVTVTAKIEFRDITADKVLWSNPALQFREEYPVTSGGDVLDAATFFGQNVNALDRLAQEFARTIVSAILEAF